MRAVCVIGTHSRMLAIIMELDKTNEFLNAFSDKYDLINEAIKSCQIAMNNCLKEDQEGLGGFSIDEIILLFDHQEVVFNHSFRNWT